MSEAPTLMKMADRGPFEMDQYDARTWGKDYEPGFRGRRKRTVALRWVLVWVSSERSEKNESGARKRVRNERAAHAKSLSLKSEIRLSKPQG
jgi:hypothetical protein